MNKDAVLIVNADTDEVLGYVDVSRPDLALVESLARVQLRARRRGERVRLRNVSDELRGLLELVGLTDVLAVEAERKPELREELRVDEVVQPGPVRLTSPSPRPPSQRTRPRRSGCRCRTPGRRWPR